MRLLWSSMLLFGGIASLLFGLLYAYREKEDNTDILVDYGVSIMFITVTLTFWYMAVVGHAQ